jgi:hypothetical protein
MLFHTLAEPPKFKDESEYRKSSTCTYTLAQLSILTSVKSCIIKSSRSVFYHHLLNMYKSTFPFHPPSSTHPYIPVFTNPVTLSSISLSDNPIISLDVTDHSSWLWLRSYLLTIRSSPFRTLHDPLISSGFPMQFFY